MIPVRRAGTPDDIAAACAFLCSEEAGLHHRPADQRQRRLVPVSDDGPRLAPLPTDEWGDDARRRAARRVRRRGRGPLPVRRARRAADAERARDADAPPGARRPVPRLQRRAAADADARAAPARAHDPPRRVAHALDVRVGAARAPRAARRHHRRGDRRRSRAAPTPTLDAARGRPARRDRPAHRSLPHRRRHLGPPGRAARRAPARGARVRRRHVHRASRWRSTASASSSTRSST